MLPSPSTMTSKSLTEYDLASSRITVPSWSSDHGLPLISAGHFPSGRHRCSRISGNSTANGVSRGTLPWSLVCGFRAAPAGCVATEALVFDSGVGVGDGDGGTCDRPVTGPLLVALRSRNAFWRLALDSRSLSVTARDGL